MNALQIKCFLAAARHLNFSESAKRLFISQSTFSRNIALVESEIGAPLFVRNNKNVILTEEGKIVLAGMEKIESAYTEMLSEVTDFSRSVSGSLTLSILEGQMLDPVLQSTVMRFEREYPGIALTLSRETYRELADMLLGGNLDIAATLAFGVRSIGALCWRRVCRLKTLLVMPIYHRMAGRLGVCLRDFKDDLFIIPSVSDCASCYEGLAENCKRVGFTPRVLEAPDIRTQMLWLEAGRGVTAANPNHMMCNSPSLTEVSIPEFLPEDFVIAWHGNNSNPAVTCFLEIFEEVRSGFAPEEG